MRLRVTTRLAALLLVVLPPAAPRADAQTGTPPRSAAERDVAEVLARVDSALLRRDREALDRLLSARFTWVAPADGRVETRESWLASAAAGTAVAGLSNQNSARTLHRSTLTLYGDPEPHTAIRTTRVRLVTPSSQRENWWAQTITLVREHSSGDPASRARWLVAHGQATYLYSGPPQDSTLLARTAGTFVVDSTGASAFALRTGERVLLEWDGALLVVHYPGGAEAPVFLASSTMQALAVPGPVGLQFERGADGRATRISLRRGERVLWRATRREP